MPAINMTGLLILTSALLISACSAGDRTEKVTLMSEEDMKSPVMAIDVTDQGVMKITGLQGARTFAMSKDKQVVLLGEAFVARNGLPLDPRRLPQELQQSNKQPLIAVVNGSAESLLEPSSSMEQWLPELRRIELELASFGQNRERGPRDRFVPYVLLSGEPAGKALIKTTVMKGDKPSTMFTLEEIQLLSCLAGNAEPSGVSLEGWSDIRANLHCQTRWSGNGDLKSPRVNAAVTVSTDKHLSIDATRRTAAEKAMEQQLGRLLRQLQEQRIDPLDVGRIIRSQYRGVWTVDRWHSAFARAAIHVNVRFNT